MVRHRFGMLAVLVVLGVTASAARAAEFFAEVARDFGSVPRGTQLAHQFRLSNPTGAGLHVASLATSCTCVAVAVERADVAPGESTVVQVSIDTRKYSGAKTFTIYVRLDRPVVEEIKLTVQAHSREDIALEPGQLDFGAIKKGSSPTASTVIRYYGGAGWQITGIENDNGYVLPELQPLKASGHIAYQLSVKLRGDTPAGAWHSDLWLKTTDATTPRIRVPLTVRIDGALTATPAEVSLGRIKSGSRGERKVVIRGSAPFKIVQIEGEAKGLQISGQTDESKAVHVLSVAFTAGADAVELSQRFRVVTDLPSDNVVEFTVEGQTVP